MCQKIHSFLYKIENLFSNISFKLSLSLRTSHKPRGPSEQSIIFTACLC